MPQNGENAYLVIKNPRATRALWWGPGPKPIRAHFIHMTSLHEVGKKGPKFLVWNPLFTKS